MSEFLAVDTRDVVIGSGRDLRALAADLVSRGYWEGIRVLNQDGGRGWLVDVCDRYGIEIEEENR